MIRKLMRDVDMYWPELQAKYPAFEPPTFMPARSIRDEAPFYLKRYIDQDPDAYYLFFKCDLTKGACDRETAAQLFKELFNDKLGLESSYTRDEMLSPLEAARKELLPADNDRHYKNFFEEQMEALRQMMAAGNAEQADAEDAWEKEHGFRRDDPDIIDVDADGKVRGAAGTAVGAAGQTGLALPKPIIYGVDLHIPAGGALGYDGGGRLGHDGRRRPDGYLREAEFRGPDNGVWPKADREKVLAATGTLATVLDNGEVWIYSDSVAEMLKSLKDFRKSQANLNTTFDAIVDPAGKSVDGYSKTCGVRPKLFKVESFENGTAALASTGGVRCVGNGVSLESLVDGLKEAGVQKFSDVKTFTIDGRPFIGWACQSRGQIYDLVFGDAAKYDKPARDDDEFLAERGPEQMMKEFVELGYAERMSDDLIEDPNGEDAELDDAGYDSRGVPSYGGSRLGYDPRRAGDGKFQEDEIRRPENRPHNLHQVDESDDGAGLNESMIRFCDRLIRG